MKKISHYLKIVTSIFPKVIIAMLLGLGSSFGKNPIKIELKNNKTIETKK